MLPIKTRNLNIFAVGVDESTDIRGKAQPLVSLFVRFIEDEKKYRTVFMFEGTQRNHFWSIIIVAHQLASNREIWLLLLVFYSLLPQFRHKLPAKVACF